MEVDNDDSNADEEIPNTSGQDGPSQQKIARPSCIFDCDVKDPHLVSLRDKDSWDSLVKAAEVHKHNGILQIAARTTGDEVPKVLYHRQCRSVFTMKKTIGKVQRSERDIPNIPEARRQSHRRSSTIVSESSRVYQPVCIFCQKSSKYTKKANTREPLIQCVELRSDTAIRDAAVAQNDKRIIAIVSRDLVAAEGHYHRSCYRAYTRTTREDRGPQAATSREHTVDQYQEKEKLCFEKLFAFVRNVVFEKPHVIKLTELTQRLVDWLMKESVEEVKLSTKKHILRKLKVQFGDTLHVVHEDNDRVLLYPDNLMMDPLVKENQQLKDELRVLKQNTSNKDKVMDEVATTLRNDVKNLDIQMPWPPLPADLNEPLEYIPNSLIKFLKTLLSGEHDQQSGVTSRVQRLTESIGQDIVHTVTHARVKTPKHILLPYAVKSLTNCVELIRILNRFGNGLSYSQLEEIDTALCFHKLAGQNDDGVGLPEFIKQFIQTSCAWDNIDRLEETLSGAGTSHRVNGIIVQRKVFGPEPLKPRSNQPQQKKRTVNLIQTDVPIYNAGTRVGPPPRAYVKVDADQVRDEVYKKSLVWILARLHCASNQSVSSWTGFNILVRDEEEIREDVVGYLPTINAPATHLSTVHEVLSQSQKLKSSLGLKSMVLVFDQALYAKATDIIWKEREKFADIVPRMGVFHTVCTLLGIIGKRFQDAGLRDLCIESGVIAEGSITGVLEGRKYNRAVRFHKLLYESLLRLALGGFLQRLQSGTNEQENTFDVTMEVIQHFIEDISQRSFIETLENPTFEVLTVQFQEYLETLRNNGGELAGVWMSYIDMVHIMLNLLRASREGDWQLNLSAIHEMIPWCFAYDRQNYARYLSVYYSEMTNLDKEHPEIHEYLKDGGFSVQIGSKNPFGKIPVDQTIEETVNKDTQTSGGTKGFSLKPNAVSRYYHTAEYRSSYLRLLRDMLGIGSSSFNHPDLSQSRIKRDEKDVESLMDLLKNSWTNPFSNSELVSISTCVVAPTDVAKHLMKARDIGETAYKTFREERLETNPPTKKFHDPLKKQNLKTFSDVKVKKTYQAGGRQIIVKADRNLFAKMILIGQTRKLSMSDVLSHRLGPIPWALATPEGTLRKTSKAALAKKLMKDLPPVENLPANSSCVIDGVALVQSLEANHMYFREVSKTILSKVLREGASSKRIDVVFDVYREQSIKNAERVKRGALVGISFRAIEPGHKIKQWRNFLCNPENKTKLIEFLVSDWSGEEHRKRLRGKEVYVTVGEFCKKLTEETVINVEDLRSTQEEADTRLLLHAVSCANAGYSSVVIVSEDTDVFVLCVAFSDHVKCPLYIKSGSQTRVQYVDIKKVAQTLGNDKCNALLGLHAFSGCDTVSAFAGRGKLSSLKLLSRSQHCETLTILGTNWQLSDELFRRLESLTCSIYSARVTTESVNDLRFSIFCAKKGEVESWQLPPCSASLQNHCKRANYQCAIWKKSLDAFPDVPNPVGNGWLLEGDKLVIDWGDGLPAPESVMEMLSCLCTRECVEETCTCIQNKLKCTYLCKLVICANQTPDGEEDESDLISDEDDSDVDSDQD